MFASGSATPKRPWPPGIPLPVRPGPPPSAGPPGLSGSGQGPVPLGAGIAPGMAGPPPAKKVRQAPGTLPPGPSTPAPPGRPGTPGALPTGRPEPPGSSATKSKR